MIETVKVCPECGTDMSKVNPIGHALHHFPEYLDPAKSGKLARERQKLIIAGGVSKAEYDKTHQESD